MYLKYLNIILFIGILYTTCIIHQFPNYSAYWSVFWSCTTLVTSYFIRDKKQYVLFLISLFALIIVWRIAAMHNVLLIMILSAFSFLTFLLWFACYITSSIKNDGNNTGGREFQWQITILRMYFGLDMLGHCTEKLFAGSASYIALVNNFDALGVGALSYVFVIIAGLCEFAIGIGIGLGFLTRAAAFGASVYFLIATIIGHHFYYGFIWANKGGGWEYPMLMIVFYFSFIFSGAGKFSIDHWLISNNYIPKRLIHLCMAPSS